MDGIEKRRKGPLGAAKAGRRKNKNGLKIKEEKMNPVGPDPGGGPNMQDFGDGNSTGQTSSKSLQDELLLNGGDIKAENPTTPQIMDKHDCNSDMMQDIGRPDFHDCKTPMNPYCYPPYNNMPPGNGQGPSHPGEFGPPPPHHHGPPGMMGGYPPPNCPPPQGQPPPPPQPTKQQPSTLEAQYMQQQSQIFVFSTKLANKAAEAVFQGQFPSIIAFHNTHPATRKFMEQYQGNSNWQPPPPQPTGKMGKGNKGQSQQHMIPAPPPNMPPDFNPQQGHPPPPWNPQQKQPPPQGYPNYYEGGGPPFCGPGMGQSPCPGGSGDQMGPGSSPMGPNHGPGNGSQPPYFGGPGGDNSSNHLSSGRLTGVQIRDEDLTPEERARREAKLANLSTIGRMLLFQENERGGDHNCHPGPPPDNMDGYNPQGGPPPGSMECMHGPNNKMPPNDWPGPGPGPGFFDGQGMKAQGAPGAPLPPPPNANGSRKGGGGSIPSPVTPLTPGSSCGGAPHRPSPHSPMSGDPMYPGPGSHSFYPSGYYSPQMGQVQENSPSGTVQRKDSESSNSEGGKSRKEKSSCSISPTSSAPPSVKEANLMPVPSPQQIQYLNVFEGQELTIQKQPNVGIPENATETSPGMPHSTQGQEMNPSTPNLNQQKPSHSSPPTPVSMSSASNQKCTPEMTNNSNNGNNSKTRPGSIGPIGTPRNSTTPNPSPQAGDRNPSQPGTPLQMNMPDMKNPNPPFGHPGGGLQSPCNPMMKPMPLMDPPDGPNPNSGGVFDNVPLNPNLAGPGPPGSKPAFDPISSMVQMSQQLGGNGNSSNPQGSGMSGPGYGMNPPGAPPMNSNMVNFNTSMHSIQSVDGGMAMGGPQTVNNTYVSATMTIQQMNIQNMPPYMNNGPNNMGPNMGPMGHQMGPMGQQMGQHMNQMGGPGNMGPQMMGGPPQNMPNHMGPGGPMSGGPPIGSMCGGGPPMHGRGPPPQMMYGNQGMPPRMGGGQGVRSSPYRMPNNGGGGPRAFGGANVQVKPNAPNTIQYLPARPPPPHNQGPMCSPPNSMGGPMHGQPRPGPNLDFLQRYTNPSPGPVVNVNMGMNVNVNMGGRMNYPGPPQPEMGGNHGMCGPMGPNGPMRPPPPHGMMDQGPDGPGGMNSGNGQPLPHPGMGMGGPGPGMKGPGPGGYPPPNSSNGPPPPNDPAYAQQFHHFQQQLYATGSNNGRNSMQSNVQGNPNNPQNQPFFK